MLVPCTSSTLFIGELQRRSSTIIVIFELNVAERIATSTDEIVARKTASLT